MQLRMRQRHPFATILQSAAVITESIAGIKIGVVRKKIGSAFRNDDIAVGSDRGVGGKGEADPRRELPGAEIHRIGSFVVELNVLVIAIL